MPKVETSVYRARRELWSNKPVMILRFFHTPVNEFITIDESQQFQIAANEQVKDAAGRGFKINPDSIAPEGWQFAQSFKLTRALRNQADLRLYMLLQKVGSPGGTMIFRLYDSVTNVTPGTGANSITLTLGNLVRLPNGQIRTIDFAMVRTDGVDYFMAPVGFDGAVQTCPFKVGSLVTFVDPSVTVGQQFQAAAGVQVGFATDPGDGSPLVYTWFEWSDGLTYGHEAIPEQSASRPNAQIATFTLAATAPPTGALTYKEMVIPTASRPAMTPGAVYWIITDHDGGGTWDQSNHVRVGIAEGKGAYPDGLVAVNSAAGPGTWTIRETDDLVFRLEERVSAVSGISPVEVPFSRDFVSSFVTLASQPGLEVIKSVRGNTQTAEPHNGRSTSGNLVVTLTDVEGEILRYIAAPVLALDGAITADSPGPGGFLALKTTGAGNGTIADLPSVGAVEVKTVVTIDGEQVAQYERIRYSAKDTVNNRLVVAERGAGGSTAAAHSDNDLVSNGEQLRQGQRVRIGLGYEGLPESQFCEYAHWEIVSRRSVGTDWEIEIADVLRKLQKDVFFGVTPDEPLKMSGNPIDLMLYFMLSTGSGSNGVWDRGPAEHSFGIPESFVDVDGILALKAAYFANFVFDFVLTGPAEAKAFLEEQFWKPLALWPAVTQQGKLTLRKMLSKAELPAPTLRLTEDDIVDWNGPYDGPILNEAVIDTDFGLDARPNDFSKRLRAQSVDSVKKFGRKPAYQLQSQGVKTASGGDVILSALFNALANRFGAPAAPPMYKLVLPYRRHELEVGDVVMLTHSKIPNAITGARGLVDEWVEIQDILPGFLVEGGLSVTVMHIGGIPTLEGGIVTDGTGTGALPPPPSGLEIVNKGNEGEWVGRDLKIRWNAVSNTAGEALGGDTPGPGTGTVPVKDYFGQVIVDGKVIREGYTTDTQTVYTYELNLEDMQRAFPGTTAPARGLEIRLWTRLVDDRLSATYAKLIATNLAPSLAGQVPSFQSAGGTVTMKWNPQAPADPDLEKYELLYITSQDAGWSPTAEPTTSAGFWAAPTDNISFTGLDPSFVGVQVRFRIRPWDVFGVGTPSEIGDGTVANQGVDTTPPAMPTGMVLTTGIDGVAPDGTVKAWLAVSLNRNTEPDMDGYLFQARLQGTTDWTTFFMPQPASGNPSGRSSEGQVPPGIIVEVRSAARDKSNNVSEWTAIQTITVASTQGAPSTPTGVTATARALGALIRWNAVPEVDIQNYEVHASTAGASFTPSSATLVGAPAGTAWDWSAPSGGPFPMTVWFKVLAVRVNPSAPKSAASAAASATIAGLGTQDIISSAISQIVTAANGIVSLPTVASGGPFTNLATLSLTAAGGRVMMWAHTSIQAPNGDPVGYPRLAACRLACLETGLTGAIQYARLYGQAADAVVLPFSVTAADPAPAIGVPRTYAFQAKVEGGTGKVALTGEVFMQVIEVKR